jgi:hypothetical protein
MNFLKLLFKPLFPGASSGKNALCSRETQQPGFWGVPSEEPGLRRDVGELSLDSKLPPKRFRAEFFIRSLENPNKLGHEYCLASKKPDARRVTYR